MTALYAKGALIVAEREKGPWIGSGSSKDNTADAAHRDLWHDKLHESIKESTKKHLDSKTTVGTNEHLLAGVVRVAKVVKVENWTRAAGADSL